MSTCPHCGEEVGHGQEFCLECGLRIPGPPPLGFAEDPGRGWARRTLVGLVIAIAGAGAAVAASGGSNGGTDLLTATGGFAEAPATATVQVPSGGTQAGILDWPAGQDGWTIALATLPQVGGRQAAVERARAARRAGLASVGVLDSSGYASLHPGYWLVFTGVFTSEAEATSSLRPARAVARTAGVRRIVP